MAARFAWSAAAERELKRRWLDLSVAEHAQAFGCSVRSVERKAIELKLPPRDPVKRAIAMGVAPTAAITLPRIRFLEQEMSA